MMNFNQIIGVSFWGVMFLVAAWTLVWKGLSLWKSARLNDRNWFIALLILNTVGILDILYIYVFSKKKHESHHREHKTV